MGVCIVPTYFSKSENSRTNLISNKEVIEQLDFLYFLINNLELTVCHFFLSAAVSHLHWFVYKADSPTAFPYPVPQVSFTKLEESCYKEKRNIQVYRKGRLCFRLKHFSVTFLAAFCCEVTRVPAVCVVLWESLVH